jgi:hypothetical protein
LPTTPTFLTCLVALVARAMVEKALSSSVSGHRSDVL